MKNWEALDRELAEIREKLAGRGRLEAMLAELDGEQQALRERKRALRAAPYSDTAPVPVLPYQREGEPLLFLWFHPHSQFLPLLYSAVLLSQNSCPSEAWYPRWESQRKCRKDL